MNVKKLLGSTIPEIRLLRLALFMLFCFLSVAASAANLSSISIAPPNPTVAIGAIPHFAATGTFDDNSTRPLTNATLSAGGDSTCIVLESGSVRCWGSNAYGQLGNNSTVNSFTPVTVSGITNAVVITISETSNGGRHSCAALATGEVWCWGANNAGQLGNNSTVNSSIPVQVSNISNAVAVAAGYLTTCAVLGNGEVWCWGDNGLGQLGNGTTTNSYIPVKVSGITTAIAISVGNGYTCAVLADHSVRCWGYNREGELGNGTFIYSSIPVRVSGINTATAITIADGGHACALLASGSMQCWGVNTSGQLGNNSTVNSSIPVTVSGITTATAITAGYQYTCAVLADHSVQCWGRNYSGVFGNGSTANSLAPVPVSGISTATAVDADFQHACARLTDNSVRCWGGNGYGQLGNGTTGASSIPVNVIGMSTASAISAGGANTCTLLADQSVQCWGGNNYGQLGNGTTADSSIPVPVSLITNTATSVVSSGGHVCALLADHSVWCWGYNGSGELGNNTYVNSSTPVNVIGITNAVAIAAGNDHSCAVLASGYVQCWGNNGNSATILGGGTTNGKSPTPVTVNGISTAIAISAGSGYTCALLAEHSVRCWGQVQYGQLGNGIFLESSATPVQVNGISTATAITAGWSHACALLASGSAQCWGRNNYGQLGNTTTTDSSIPVNVSGIATYTAIATAESQTCALLADHSVQCWGSNDSGQLGNGTVINSSVPVPVSEISNAIAITTARSGTYGGHSCATLASGMVQCWGSGSIGILGNVLCTSGGCPDSIYVPIRVANIYTGLGLDWTSSNAPVARLDEGGYALGLSPGQSTVSATYGSVTGSTLLTVDPYTNLHDFNCLADGCAPQYPALLAQGRDGNLYGTAFSGGSNNVGTVFKVTPSGTLTRIYNFNGTTGANPYGGLTLGTDGNFYGTTLNGGTFGLGTIFKITPAGILKVLHHFGSVAGEGSHPYGAPTLGTDGSFYGVTGSGKPYKTSASGTYKRLNSSTVATHANLIQANDGNFYGTRPSPNSGTVFKMTTAGVITTLYTFDVLHGSQPEGPVVQGADGNLYGTTKQGGTLGSGVVFKLTLKGVITVLKNMDATAYYPFTGLVAATDGNFYGATSQGGTSAQGAVFKITTTGTTTIESNFDFMRGGTPYATPMQSTNGKIYGLTYGGGANGQGVFYSLDETLPPYAGLPSVAAKVGVTIGILGQGFTGTTAVSFGGTAATTFTVVSDTYLTAQVPVGALTGNVTVTRPTGTLTSNRVFRVTPAILSFTPISGHIGTSVAITGSGLTQTTKVTIGGKTATFIVNSSTQVTATVPATAVTGKVVITTLGGKATSAGTFTITP